MRRFILALASLAVALTFADAFAKSPRERLHKTSNEEFTAEDAEAEREFGRQVAARILGRFPLLEEMALCRYVGLLGTALAEAGGRDDLDFKFAILDTEVPNAFAAPGGFVFITKGAIMRMQDEAELSAVLAHEISHVSRRHIVRELNIRGDSGDLAGGLARVIGGAGDVSRVAMGKLVDVAQEILFDKGYASDDELEADTDALTLTGAVGYDPTGLQRYLARVDDKTKPVPASIKSTHPAYAMRKSRIDDIIAKDGLAGANRPDMKERFNENVKIR